MNDRASPRTDNNSHIFIKFNEDQPIEGFDTAHLVSEYSPSIPYDFPKELIPKNICEMELLKLSRCVTKMKNEGACSREYANFLVCKKDRDLYLYDEIKKWEIDSFLKKGLEDRAKYMKELRDKLSFIEKENNKIPFLSIYQQKKNRVQSDIEQLTWRLSYLKKA